MVPGRVGDIFSERVDGDPTLVNQVHKHKENIHNVSHEVINCELELESIGCAYPHSLLLAI